MAYSTVLGVPHSYQLTPRTQQTSVTLVFVHGWLLSQCYWQPVIERLPKDFQCLSYDLRGFGQSNRALEARSPQSLTDTSKALQPPHPYSLEAYGEDLGALLTALELHTPVWLVGHSLGGSVALWAAKLFPKQVQGIICVNAGGGVYLPDEFARFRQAGRQIVRWRPQWLGGCSLFHLAFTRMMVHQPLEMTWGKQRVADLLSAHGQAAEGILLESTTESEVHQLPQIVAALPQPTYFVAGAQDTIMAVRYVQHLASFHSLFGQLDGNVRILPDCGHMAMVEQPATLAAIIQELVPTITPAEKGDRSYSNSV
ncbi:MAG: alpha/beta hydrolase [Cyanobacteria bacterium P01_C01_bin.120]